MLLIILKILGGLTLLIVAGQFLVKGSVEIAKYLKMSKLVIGLTIVAMGTSAPELLVSVSAALKGNSVISLGNVIGSNIVNIGFILGLTTIIFPMSVKRQTIFLDFPIMFVSYAMLFLFMFDGNLSILEGSIFVISLLVYIWYEIYYSKKKAVIEPVVPIINKKEEKEEKRISIPIAIALVIGASAGLAFGADLFVNGATSIAKMLNISDRIISLTLVALGTSLPELFASIIAAFKKEAELSVGNVIGSNIFNILSILGITAIIKPMNFDFNLFFRDLLWMGAIGGLLLLAFFPLKTKFISRFEGALMLVAYIVYVILLF